MTNSRKASDFLSVTWRAIPSLRSVDTKMAVKDPETCNSCVVTNGTWGSENTPVVLISDIPLVIAAHIVSLHNDSFAVKASA